MVQNEKKYVSKEKYEELKKELEELKTVKRKEIAEQLEFAKSLGDLSENAEYQHARESQAKLEDRIAYIDDMLKKAEIVKDGHKSYASVGSFVTIREEKDNIEKTWHIVGSVEADFKNRQISNESPLGSALLGKKIGDRVELVTPKGKRACTVIKLK